MRRRLALAVALSCACSFDWMIGAGGGDASAPDAMSDATTDAPPDARDAGAMDVVVADANCAALTTSLAATRATSLECMQVANQCTTAATDECGCTFYVDDKGQYVAALGAYEDGGCKPASCPMPCPTPMKLCLISDASSTGYACQ